VTYIKCNACPAPGQCDEFNEGEGACLNAVMLRMAANTRPAAVSINDPALAAHPVAQANAASWATVAPPRPRAAPTAREPGAAKGSVTAQIFTVCDAVLAELGGGAGKEVLDRARAAAIPRLEAAGVNPNSARKGSSMWVAARI
jgi:hypothetical protein